MSKLTQEHLERLIDFLESLPTEAKGKCALCNTTLVHIVKHAEAETGAGTATVTRVLAEQINASAAPQDRVSGEQLRDRVRYQAGEKVSGKIPQIKKLTKAEKIEAVDSLMVGGMSRSDAIRKVAKGEGRDGINRLELSYSEHFRRRQNKALENIPALAQEVQQLVTPDRRPQEAVSIISQKYGVTPDAIMDAYLREVNPQKLGVGDPKRGGQAVYFAGLAISQLRRIDTDDDPDWPEAIRMVKAWLAEWEGVQP